MSAWASKYPSAWNAWALRTREGSDAQVPRAPEHQGPEGVQATEWSILKLIHWELESQSLGEGLGFRTYARLRFKAPSPTVKVFDSEDLSLTGGTVSQLRTDICLSPKCTQEIQHPEYRVGYVWVVGPKLVNETLGFDWCYDGTGMFLIWRIITG